jgi:hypothetical protein
MKTIEYPYKPRLSITMSIILFCGGCAAMMTYAALTNDRGLIINGIIRLEQPGATIFYWCMAGIFDAALAVSLAMVVIGLTSKAHLRLTQTEFSAPRHGFSQTSTTIPLAEIHALRAYAVHDQHFLDISHSSGTLTILRSCLPSTAAFEDVCGQLGALVNGRRG